ncbi:MAG: hypothetical protein WCO63_05060 [Bacteroidota bacterium]
MTLFTLANNSGIRLNVLNFGRIITSLWVPDRQREAADIVLGHDLPESYLRDSAYFGAIIGPYASRIAGGTFSIGGEKYHLTKNEGHHHLHGGIKGFNSVYWEVTELQNPGSNSLILEYFSKDGEEGYPGNLKTNVFFSLNDSNELLIEYSPSSDKPTPLKLCQHSYFNQAGKGDVLGHILQVTKTMYKFSNI